MYDSDRASNGETTVLSSLWLSLLSITNKSPLLSLKRILGTHQKTANQNTRLTKSRLHGEGGLTMCPVRRRSRK